MAATTSHDGDGEQRKEEGRTTAEAEEEGGVESEAYVEIVRFLNQVRTAHELAAEVELPGKRDVGLKVAENILAKRTALAGCGKTA